MNANCGKLGHYRNEC